ncbi:HNH endonuclease [Aliikangiella sp. G2MR2-5]|uniref:HNH endonuclease n=1 Tax=Aliikangiella sp. G2MR2-5 TaxID=2788943 RepID=UPI0018ABDB11
MEECIICRNLYTKNNPRTSEHIIPEFVGGALKFECVCKLCNSSMGKDFEGRLSNSFLLKSYRYLHKILGKSIKIEHPFSGMHRLDDGRLFTIHRDGRYELNSSINIEPDSENSKRYHFLVNVDEANASYIEDLVIKKAKRMAKKTGTNYTESSITKSVREAIAESEFKTKTIKNPELTIEVSLNLSDMELLYIKIAYELACFQFGYRYILDPVANNLRLSLHNLSVHNDVSLSVLEEENEIVRNVFTNDYYWAFFTKNACYIKLFSMVGVVIFSSPDALEFRTDNVYRFCYKSNSWKILDYQEMIRNFLRLSKKIPS